MRAAAQPATRSAHPAGTWLVGTLTAAVFISSTFWLSLGPFLPVLAREFDTSVALLGQIPALLTLLAALIGAVVGPLAGRLGYRATLLVGLFGILLASLATGLAPAPPLLLLAALFGALGRAAVLPIAQAAAACNFTEQARWRAISRASAGISAAAILGVPLMTSAAALFHWRVAFLSLAAVTVLIGLGVWLVLDSRAMRSQPVRSPVDELAALSSLWRQRNVGLVGATFLGLMSTWTVQTYVGAFFVEMHGLGVGEIGWIYTVIGTALLLGTLLAGRRFGRLAPRSAIIGSRACSGPLFGLAVVLPLSVPESVALLALGVLLVGVAGSATAALLADETPVGRATTLSLNGSAMNLGAAFGASLGGLMLIAGGYPALAWCSTACALGAGTLVWLTGRRGILLPPPAGPTAS